MLPYSMKTALQVATIDMTDYCHVTALWYCIVYTGEWRGRPVLSEAKQAASLTERNNTLAHSLSYRDPHFGLLLGFGSTFGVFSYFRCKIWRHSVFLLGDPDFLWRRRNFAPMSLSYRALTRDRQTDDRRDDRYRRLLHLQCASLKSQSYW